MRILKLAIFFLLLQTNVEAATPKRIVSLNPALTETLFALGVGQQIVGTTEFSDQPEEAKKIPRVGSYVAPSVEKILALKPDLVLASSEGVDSYSETLKRSKIKYLVFASTHLEDYPKLIEALGLEFDIKPSSKKLLDEWNSAWQKIRDENKGKQSHSIMIEVDHDPLMVVGGGTFLTEALAACKIENAFSNLKGYPRINLEDLKNRTLDALVIFQFSKINRWNEIQKSWNQNPMTRNKPLIKADPDSLSRLGPRLPKSVEKVCANIHMAFETPHD